MTNLSYGKNVVYFLNDLAASEVSDITSGEFESYGEDGQGRDASCSIDITLLAADAVSMIAALQEQVQKLAAENAQLKEINALCGVLANNLFTEKDAAEFISELRAGEQP